MKNLKRSLSLLIAIVMATAFMVVPAFAGAVTAVEIDGVESVGNKLTANISGGDIDNIVEEITWYRSSVESAPIASVGQINTFIAAETTKELTTEEDYKLVAEDKDNYIYVVIDVDNDGTITKFADSTGKIGEYKFDNGIQAAGAAQQMSGSAFAGWPTADLSNAISPASIKIDLDNEKMVGLQDLTDPENPVDLYKIAIYSVDGGTKWITKAFPADLAKLLDKGMKLIIADKGDKNGPYKVPDDKTDLEGDDLKNATVISFAEVKARAKKVDDAVKLVVNYGVGGDATGDTPGQWTLTPKDGTAAYTNWDKLQVVMPANGKKFDGSLDADGNPKDKWGKFGAGGTINVEDFGMVQANKVSKRVYFVRTAPDSGTGTPASKAMKLSASSLLKPLALKPDYKKEVLAVKPGVILSNSLIAGDNKKYEDKATPSIASNLQADKSISLYVFIAAGKKPATAKAEVKLAPRADAPKGQHLAVANGKVTWDSKLEAKKVAADEKWGKFPKVDAAGALGLVRVKNTAKFDKNAGFTGEAASEAVNLTWNWVKLNPDKDKMGVTRAVINGGDPVKNAEEAAAVIIAAIAVKFPGDKLVDTALTPVSSAGEAKTKVDGILDTIVPAFVYASTSANHATEDDTWVVTITFSVDVIGADPAATVDKEVKITVTVE